MNKKNATFLIRFFFIVTALIYLVKAEGSFFAPSDFCYYSNPTEVELVVTDKPEYDFSSFELDRPPKLIPDFTHTHIDFSSINKFALLHYHNYVLHQLNSFNRTFTPNHQLTSILQKHNIWHQSSEEVPLLLG